jgi:hypothetical protein
MDEDEAERLLKRVKPSPSPSGFACDRQKCEEVSIPQGEYSGTFWSGAIDLTGDGIPEIVRRQGETVLIFQDGDLAWRSPPGWRVVDLALGDPNDDGRSEVVLALKKLSSGGGVTSHPFILGHRGGKYKVLWGGSAVSEPILEIELGDLDGDQVEELVALEESAVSVWRWHGWGFALVWRSPAGNYQELALIPKDDGAGELVVVTRGD